MKEQHDAGGETVLQPAVQALIDFDQHLGGLGRELGQRADGADDEGYSHRSFESFAAYIAQDDER